MNQEEASKAAQELVKLTIEQNALKDKINELKDQLLEYTNIEDICDTSWSADNGYVEIQTKTKYTLAELNAEFQIPESIIDAQTAEEVFKTKIALTRNGKQRLLQGDEVITKLVIPQSKKVLKVIV